MIRPPHCLLRRPVQASRSAHGFTLIELLTVMAIMLLLAGLILGIAGSANTKGSLARAQSEIQQMSTAMESYKVDNGAYPRDTPTSGVTDMLNAQTSTDPSGYVASSKFLFTELSGVNSTAASPKKAYVTFLPSQLAPANTTPTAGTTYIIDPFGFSFGYSTAYQGAQDTNTSGAGGLDLSTYGFNPTFDLWSTGGYGPAGKAYPTNNLPANKRYTLWVKNW